MIEKIAKLLLQISADPAKLPPQVGHFWSKSWLERQHDLFKVRKKSIAVTRNNVQDSKMMMEYFEIYKAVVDEFEIQPED